MNIQHYQNLENNLVNYTALDKGLNNIYQTQFEASDLESLGLLKMDFLGLKNLTNISKTIDLIHQDNPNFVMPKEENDPAVYRMLANKDVVGVFQLESAGMSNVIQNLRTSNLNDIISALALYRPGPMEIIPTFIKRKFKEEIVTYPHNDLKEILEETYGTIFNIIFFDRSENKILKYKNKTFSTKLYK